jgi:hypothetical protein
MLLDFGIAKLLALSEGSAETATLLRVQPVIARSTVQDRHIPENEIVGFLHD